MLENPIKTKDNNKLLENVLNIFSKNQIGDAEKFFYLLPDLFAVLDLDEDIRWANLAFENSFGRPVAEITEKNFFEFIHPDEGQMLRKFLSDLPLDKVSKEIELRLKQNKDSFIYTECFFYKDSQNNVCYLLARDISDKIKYKDELLKLTAIVEASMDAIYAIDLNGNIASWNNAAENIFGYSREEIIGRPISTLALPGQEESINLIIEKIRKGDTFSYETIRLRKTGEIVTVFITLAPIVDTFGEIVGTSAVARDITEHQRLEKEVAQLDKLNTIVELASVISHEVRNPMTTVKGFLEHMKDKIRSNEFQEYFSIMLEEMDRVNSILQEFNTIGKSRTIKIKENKNLNVIIRSLNPLLEADAAYQGKSLTTSLDEIPDLYVNENEIRQLLLNLTRNGLEAMENSGTLTIKTYNEKDKVILAVQDEGEGIPPEVIKKIGTPFFSTKEKGTGLGLYVCYEIAERNNAKIRILTNSSGTTFLVEFMKSQ